jgi:SNF2 family DNA or RNA helicase
MERLNAVVDVQYLNPALSRVYDHQVANVERMAKVVNKKLLVCDDPGLGKTVTACLVYALRQTVHGGVCRAIIVSPKSVINQWKAELTKFTSTAAEDVLVIDGGNVSVERLKDAKVVIVGYERLQVIHNSMYSRQVVKGTRGVPRHVTYVEREGSDINTLAGQLFKAEGVFQLAVFDEIHTLRNGTTAKHMTTLDLAPGRRCWRVGLTGTPLVNRMDDLFYMCKVLQLDEAYTRDFFRDMSQDRDKLQTFKSGPFVRSTKAILGLPQLNTITVRPKFTDDEMDTVMKYAAAVVGKVDDYLATMGHVGGKRPANSGSKFAEVLVAFHRLKQACIHPMLPGISEVNCALKKRKAAAKDAAAEAEEEEEEEDTDTDDGDAKRQQQDDVEEVSEVDMPATMFSHYKMSAKFRYLVEQLPVLTEGFTKGVLIYCSWATPLQAVQHLLQYTIGLDGCELYAGSTSGPARERMVANFMSGKTKVLLLTYGAGGVGVNLSVARVVIHLDAPWTPAAVRQATDRAHRIGVTGEVTEVFLAPAYSSDQYIFDNVHGKKKAAMTKLEELASAMNVEAGGNAALDILTFCVMADFYDAKFKEWQEKAMQRAAAKEKKAAAAAAEAEAGEEPVAKKTKVEEVITIA